MTLEADVAKRIRDNVPELAVAVEEVAELAALLSAGSLPQRPVAAFVCPLGFDERAGGESMTSLHTQMLEEAIGVVLVIQALGDPKARRALPTITTLRTAVIAAIAGWAPDGVAGVFRATRGRLVNVDKGLVIYQLDFAMLDQLRITPT